MAVWHLSSGFSPGSVVTLKGCVKDDPDRFEVNLQCGPVVPLDIVSDIALHVNPRFDEEVIVRNSMTNGFWGYEEREGDFFFNDANDFKIQIHSERRGFKIVVDNCPFIYYKHRQDLSAVSHISAGGDIIIYEVDYRPIPAPEEDYCVPKSTVPFKYVFPGDFKPGSALVITGKVRGDIDRFTVNLVCGECPDMQNGICELTTVALHFNVRFDQDSIVRNTMINGEWGPEQIGGNINFRRDTDFSLKIVCERDKFQIFVDNVYCTAYKHRVDPCGISYVYIHGGIYLFDIVHR